MRLRFKPGPEQRTALRAQLARLQQPTAVLGILRSVLAADFNPTVVIRAPQSVHSDRFVMRVQLRSNGGKERAYALKVLSDEFGERIWGHAQALAARRQPNHESLCLPSRSIPHERSLPTP